MKQDRFFTNKLFIKCCGNKMAVTRYGYESVNGLYDVDIIADCLKTYKINCQWVPDEQVNKYHRAIEKHFGL